MLFVGGEIDLVRQLANDQKVDSWCHGIVCEPSVHRCEAWFERGCITDERRFTGGRWLVDLTELPPGSDRNAIAVAGVHDRFAAIEALAPGSPQPSFARARMLDGVPIATPIDWSELGRAEPRSYTVTNRLRRLGHKPDT